MSKAYDVERWLVELTLALRGESYRQRDRDLR